MRVVEEHNHFFIVMGCKGCDKNGYTGLSLFVRIKGGIQASSLIVQCANCDTLYEIKYRIEEL